MWEPHPDGMRLPLHSAERRRCVSDPANGSASTDGTTITYTPDPDFFGVDCFFYDISDGSLTDTATVCVTVTAVNDAPSANDDAATTEEDTAVVVPVLDNDSDVDGDPLAAVLVTGPSNGFLTLNPDGSFIYTPAVGFSGTDSFTYQSSDGVASDTATVTITVRDAGSPGRMTGGGTIGNTTARHGFELHCDSSVNPNRLEVNWGKGNKFHLETLLTAQCSDDPAIGPNPPSAGFDTYHGTGLGRFNGIAGATIEWTFTDAGEPGRNDFATIIIRDVNGFMVLNVSGFLKNGNHQAHTN